MHDLVNWSSWLFWGFVSTLLLSTVAAGLQGLGLTRMNLPYMLGTMFTADRDRARLYGFAVHLIAGWMFSLLYVLTFGFLREANWWHGAIIGVIHGLFVLVVGVSMLPGIHPRMASEQHGPRATRELEPPGFLALNYGVRTPLSVLASHLIFGAILGAFYNLPR
jgi:xanthine/uracil permease